MIDQFRIEHGIMETKIWLTDHMMGHNHIIDCLELMRETNFVTLIK